MSDPIIRVENLGKRYQLGANRSSERYTALRDVLANKAKSLFQRNGSHAAPTEEFWALKDVNFEIQQGEVVGIIGRNGAGKSTLLKILSRITEPTTGRIHIKGRVASLLEVGTGFHPELTGRENIYLNGAILGMHRAEIKAKFDEIVAFAEVEKFLDTPVKRYSSGMYVRLAFAVAAHLEPEILIVDEVLAVGDAEFQKKCLGKMHDVSRGGRTVLFVSHNMGAIVQLCTRGILLKHGREVLFESARKAAAAYTGMSADPRRTDKAAFAGTLVNAVSFESVSINQHLAGEAVVVSPSSRIRISVHGVAKRDIPAFRTSLSLFRDGIRFLTMHDVKRPALLKTGHFEADYQIPAFFLRPGYYSVAVGGYKDGMDDWIWGKDVAALTVAEEWSETYDPVNIGWVNVETCGQRRPLP